eukprot:m.265069 g.265069  ORF g.265069 m.265069 type:complete len:357 (+) comp28531_c0_seq1:242-1312(+)
MGSRAKPKSPLLGAELSDHMVTWDGEHIIRYREDQILHFGFLKAWRGTVFHWKTGATTWVKFFFLTIVAVLVAFYTAETLSPTDIQGDAAGWRASVSSLATLLNSLLVFFIGFHVADLKSRYMEVKATVAALSNSLESLVLFAARLPQDARGRAETLRYVDILFQLVWYVANGIQEYGFMNLDDDERSILCAHTKPSLAILQWLYVLLKKGCDTPESSAILQDRIATIKNAYDAVVQRASSQLPFSYTHLLAFVANVTLFAVAMDVGQDAGTNYLLHNSSRILFDTFKLILMTFVYQGLLELQILLRHPLSLVKVRPVHLPRHHLQNSLRHNIHAIMELDFPNRVTDSHNQHASTS